MTYALIFVAILAALAFGLPPVLDRRARHRVDRCWRATDWRPDAQDWSLEDTQSIYVVRPPVLPRPARPAEAPDFRRVRFYSLEDTQPMRPVTLEEAMND